MVSPSALIRRSQPHLPRFRAEGLILIFYRAQRDRRSTLRWNGIFQLFQPFQTVNLRSSPLVFATVSTPPSAERDQSNDRLQRIGKLIGSTNKG